MAYGNFKPVIWSKYIEHELKKFTVFKEDCDYRFEGEAGKGKTVKILGVGKPTIGDYTGASIGAPETVADSSVTLLIDQAKFFNFQVDDVDKAQAQEGLMPALMEEATRALAYEEDKFIGQQLAKEAGKKIKSRAIADEAAAVKVVDEMFEALWSNGVSNKDKVTIYVTPWFYNLFKNRLVELKTDNDDLIAKGVVGMYNSAKVKMSSFIHNDGTDDHIIVKTSKGYAFCNGINETEAYRPEGLFSDAVKGLDTFGGKAVRPKEIVAAAVHKA